MERIKRWPGSSGDNALMFSAEEVSTLPLPDHDRSLLCESGLPAWAAPNISFRHFSHRPDGVVEFGEDRDDRPFALRPKSSAVWVQTASVPLEFGLVNSSLSQLVEVLAAYDHMVARALQDVGDDAFIDNRIPAHLISEFETQLEEFDPLAAGDGCFWPAEIGRLRSCRRD